MIGYSSNLPTLIRIALEEDIGDGDVTTQACVDKDLRGEASIIAKSGGMICGQEIAREVFKTVDEAIRYAPLVQDGARVEANTRVADLAGPVGSILSAERTALNFLMRLSGISTKAAQYAAAVEGTSCRVLDTRKTIPGYRSLEKYAARCGGISNHRAGLYDMVLIKENHIRAAGSVRAALDRVANRIDPKGRAIKVEIEVTTIKEVEQAIQAGADWIMFDNMSLPEIKSAVETVRKSRVPVITEVSGGVTLETVRRIAETGVDFVSIGEITHSAPALDLSLVLERIIA